MTAPWLLLVHQIPRKPDYLRVKVGRRLQRVGAVAIKNSVYVLPVSDQALEDFQWVLREIVDGGGEASICRASFVDGLSDAEVERLLRAARVRDFEEIAAELRIFLRSLPARRRVTPPRAERLRAELTRVQRRLEALAPIDFFDGRRHSTVDTALREVESRLFQSDAPARPRRRARGDPRPRGGTWVTRRGIFVDRIASAWLIRRFIDPDARFAFVDPRDEGARSTGDKGARSAAGEIRFDMVEAEYTHEGDRCTFETLLRRFALADPALLEIGAIVHDIDLRDGKFAREEAPGIERVLAGIAAAHAGDEARLERGAQVFEALYALFRGARHD